MARQEEGEVDKNKLAKLICPLILFYLSLPFIVLAMFDDFWNGKPTARITATFREASTHHFPPHEGGDNYAHMFSWPVLSYCLSSSPVCRWIAYVAMSYSQLGNVFGHVVGRTFVIDQIITDQLSHTSTDNDNYNNNDNSNNNDHNYKQFVILGAGYDTRGLRFKDLIEYNDIKVFEVDLKSTQKQKKKKLKQYSKKSIEYIHLRKKPNYLNYVSIDFNKESLLGKLKQAGYDDRLQTLFLFEGVSYYLDKKSVSNTLKFVSEHSGINSLIIWDLFHTCFLDLYGKQYITGKHSRQLRKYCNENGMSSGLYKVYGLFGSFLFNSILDEPFYFGLKWDIDNPYNTGEKKHKKHKKYQKGKKKNMDEDGNDKETKGKQLVWVDIDQFNELYTFHQENCMTFEKYYDKKDFASYLTYDIGQYSNKKMIQRKLVDIVMPGMAVVTSRKTKEMKTCQVSTA